MIDGKWLEEICRTVCRKKGITEDKWESEKAAVIQVIEAMRESGAVVVPIVGEVK